MRLEHIIKEANAGEKVLKDPKMTKRLTIAISHDSTIPRAAVARLGPKPDPTELIKLWSDLIDKSLRATDYGDVSDGKFDDWLTRMYINGAADYEDINGEGGDALGAWRALSQRGKLKPMDQDFNRFKTLRQLQKILGDRAYRDELRKIKDAEVIEKHKRTKEEIPLIDNERFLVVIPLNYGACYTFNNANGVQANFCTGSSSGLHWFQNYAPNGPVVSIFDKARSDEVEGKWQFHAATNQLVDAEQTRRHDVPYNDERFAKLFPGLMKEIADAMTAKAEEIKERSKVIARGGYDVAKEVAEIKRKYPLSYNSKVEEPEEAPAEEPAADDQDGPGTYAATHGPTNRTVNIQGQSRQDVLDQIRARNPQLNMDEITLAKVG
jgi:hypothetical protein